MADTKRKILDKALELFNERGSEKTTVRHIAAELGISHGNLCYHYPNTDEIVKALYNELVSHLNSSISAAVEFSLVDLMQVTEKTFELFYQYRFILIEFVAIARRIHEVKTHFRELQKHRDAEFGMMFQRLQEDGLMKPELFPGQYELLKEQMTLVGDFWMSEAEILFDGSREEKIRHYARLFNSLMVPYLTEKGIMLYLIDM